MNGTKQPRLCTRFVLSCLFSFLIITYNISQLNQAWAKAEPINKSVVNLPELSKITISQYFKKELFNSKKIDQILANYEIPPQMQKAQGVFVTLSRDGKTRACWGSIYPQYKNVAIAAIHTTIGALTKDYRYPPVKAFELKNLKAQVTVVKAIEPIENLSGQNPLRDGLLVRSSGKTGVILPGEAKDAYYQFVLCKLKAGIKPGEALQLYRLKTDIYG